MEFVKVYVKLAKLGRKIILVSIIELLFPELIDYLNRENNCFYESMVIEYFLITE